MPLSGAALQPAETAPQPAGERKKGQEQKRAKYNSPPPCQVSGSGYSSWGLAVAQDSGLGASGLCPAV